MVARKKKPRKFFWQSIHELVKNKYQIKPVQVVGKLNALFKVAADHDVHLMQQEDQLITRVKLENLFENLMDYKYNSGFFFEYDAIELADVLPLCDIKCQTLTYLGLSTTVIKEFFLNCRPLGVDRAVPMGKSMDFTLVWDGYDLIRELSRKFSVL